MLEIPHTGACLGAKANVLARGKQPMGLSAPRRNAWP
jgi:hypothetical protein